LCRLEGHCGFDPALVTGCPGLRPKPRATARALGFALFAAFGIVLELLIVKEELLARRENKLASAVDALQYSICEFHHRLP
jgi:hypothetical protein